MSKNKKPKILIYDIENSPTVVTTWGLFEQNAIETLEEWYIMSYSYKWYGEKKVHTVALPDFKGYEKNKTDDSKLCESLYKLFDEADIIIAHNGDKHDQLKSNARFIFHGFKPPSPYKTLDTRKVAKKHFKFNSNSLNNLCVYLGLGEKMETPKGLWRGCMDGDMKSWMLMKKYNKQDVILLEKLYVRLLPWMSHPNRNLYQGTNHSCPNCGSKKCQRRGTEISSTTVYQRWQCQDCGKWSKSTMKDNSVNR